MNNKENAEKIYVLCLSWQEKGFKTVPLFFFSVFFGGVVVVGIWVWRNLGVFAHFINLIGKRTETQEVGMKLKLTFYASGVPALDSRLLLYYWYTSIMLVSAWLDATFTGNAESVEINITEIGKIYIYILNIAIIILTMLINYKLINWGMHMSSIWDSQSPCVLGNSLNHIFILSGKWQIISNTWFNDNNLPISDLKKYIIYLKTLVRDMTNHMFIIKNFFI